MESTKTAPGTHAGPGVQTEPRTDVTQQAGEAAPEGGDTRAYLQRIQVGRWQTNKTS